MCEAGVTGAGLIEEREGALEANLSVSDLRSVRITSLYCHIAFACTCCLHMPRLH